MVDKVKYSCPECQSTHNIGHGSNITRQGEHARRKCKECGRTFYAEENKVGGKE